MENEEIPNPHALVLKADCIFTCIIITTKPTQAVEIQREICDKISTSMLNIILANDRVKKGSLSR